MPLQVERLSHEPQGPGWLAILLLAGAIGCIALFGGCHREPEPRYRLERVMSGNQSWTASQWLDGPGKYEQR